jgi:hypothetical protein
MMRSFSSRPDTAVLDEPFYAHYLNETHTAHPGREAVIAACETNWKKIVHYITGDIPGGRAIWYQKHMAHHMLPHIDLGPLIEPNALAHTFLIRDPVEVINSYTKVHADMNLAMTGLPSLAELFDCVAQATGKCPPVVDAKDILLDPQRTLSRLCESLGISFLPCMLQWPAGPHPSDGNWAPYWYANVYRSTGFEPYRPNDKPIAASLEPILEEATQLYKRLAAHKL